MIFKRFKRQQQQNIYVYVVLCNGDVNGIFTAPAGKLLEKFRKRVKKRTLGKVKKFICP